MKRTSLLMVVFFTSLVLAACDQLTTDKTAPTPSITAQGFHIESVQEGIVGQFGSLRLRIESPGRIDKLQIKERSYQIDLATTPERAHFNLFGIERKPLLSQDVTLDFQNYINQKLEKTGEYTILVEVIDKLGQVSKVNIVVLLQEPTLIPEPAKSEPAQSPEQSKVESIEEAASLKTGHFEIQRIGPREVEGGKVFGLTWKTINEIFVTIRVRKKDEGATKLAGLSASDYDNVVTGIHLNQLLESVPDKDYVDFETANNAGVDQVLGVVNLGKAYVIKTSQSITELSSLGTTVTLKGEYKYQ